MLLKDFSKYEGIPYLDGKDDCYGLLRKFYKEEYGKVLTNYARPADAFWSGLNLLNLHFSKEGFEIQEIGFSLLEPGDMLFMQIGGCPNVNHCAIYVGGGHILHHIHNQLSVIEAFDIRWKRRTMTILRHPVATEANRAKSGQLDITELMPPHVRQRIKERTAE